MVQFRDSFELGFAQIEFLFQPGQFRLFVSMQFASGGHAGKINATEGSCCQDQTKNQDEKTALHEITAGEFDKGRGRASNVR